AQILEIETGNSSGCHSSLHDERHSRHSRGCDRVRFRPLRPSLAPMAVLPKLVLWLAAANAIEPAVRTGLGYRPTGSLDALSDLGALPRVRDPLIRAFRLRIPQGYWPDQVEPRDRLPNEQSRRPVARLTGPGIIQCIGLTDSAGGTNWLDRSGSRLKIFVD